jgi:nitrate reductase alpha subunit
MQDFLAGGFVLPKASKSWSLHSSFSSNSSMLTILGKHLSKQVWLYKQDQSSNNINPKCSINKHGVASGQADSNNREWPMIDWFISLQGKPKIHRRK